MKKVLPIVLIVALAFCLTSCNPEALGSFMGKMGQNVFGLKANMKDVNNATQKVDGAVTDNGDGTVSIDLEKAAGVIDDIGKIKASSGKKEEFQKQLAEPVSEENGEAVQVALQSAIQDKIDIIDSLPEPSDPVAKDIVDKVKAALEEAKAGISDNPSKADLVAVAVISDMAGLAKDIADDPSILEDDPVSVVDKGLAALDTLKIVSEFAGLSLVDGIDFSALLDELDKEIVISRDEEDDAIKYVAMAAKNVRALIGLFTKNGVVNDIMYSSVLAQAKAARHSFELMAAPYIPKDKSALSNLDPILSNKAITANLTTDDFILYFECLMLTEFDKDDFKTFVNTYYENLIDLEHKAGDEAMGSALQTLSDSVITKLQDKDVSWNALGTMAVLLVKTNLKDTIFNIADVESFSAFIEGL